jgi:EipB-like
MRRALRLAAIAQGLTLLALAPPALAAPPDAPVFLAPHRAVYDLKLLKTTGSRGISSVRGRILYDFSGSACEGYTLKFRQVSEIDSGETRSTLSDLRSTTWEDGTARKFSFNSQNLMNERSTEAVDGHAERGAKALTVTLAKPEAKKLTLPLEAVFPTDHMRRIVLAAREGKSILEFQVYDGSDNGQKLYHTLTVIGRAIAPGAKPPSDAAAKIPALAKLTRWPVTISYFEKESEKKQQTGEQTPAYSISFELYENGISRALILDYADFSLTGELTSLELKNVTPCN